MHFDKVSSSVFAKPQHDALHRQRDYGVCGMLCLSLIYDFAVDHGHIGFYRFDPLDRSLEYIFR